MSVLVEHDEKKTSRHHLKPALASKKSPVNRLKKVALRRHNSREAALGILDEAWGQGQVKTGNKSKCPPPTDGVACVGESSASTSSEYCSRTPNQSMRYLARSPLTAWLSGGRKTGITRAVPQRPRPRKASGHLKHLSKHSFFRNMERTIMPVREKRDPASVELSEITCDAARASSARSKSSARRVRKGGMMKALGRRL